jgi:hypothetical protein
VTGFFNATQRRVFAHVSWGALKKPTEREAFGCKALGKAICEDVDAVDKSETIYNLEKVTTNEVS